MPRRDDVVNFMDMLDHSHEAVEMLRSKSRGELDRDREMNLALVRLLEIIGEAANRVPTDERERYPDIASYQIIGVRNRLIHGYDSVDLDIVWQIVWGDLPPRIASLERIVRGFAGRSS